MAGADVAPRLVVEIHDVAPATWPGVSRVLAAIGHVAPVPLSLLVVPTLHGDAHAHPPAPPAAFHAALDARRAAGDELVLHGLTHRDDGRPRAFRDRVMRRWYTAGEGEFSALSAAEASRRLGMGLAWFARAGWPVAGFVAPAWLAGPGTWQALRHTGLSYTATIDALHPLDGRAPIASRSLVWSTRAAWRRGASLAWNAALARRLRDARVVRIALHPADADHAAVRRQWQDLITRFLADRRAVTTIDAIDATGAARGDGRVSAPITEVA
jgi:predicted deacetylase